MATKYWVGGATNHENEWDYDTSTSDTIDATALSNPSGTIARFTAAAHPFAANDEVTIAGLAGGLTVYNGDQTIVAVDTNTFDIDIGSYTAGTPAGTETVTACGNWRLSSDGSYSAKPTGGDVVLFDNRAGDDSTTGNHYSANENIDATGTGTPDLAGLYISPTFTGDIGASGEYLEVEADGDEIIFSGTGTLYLKLSAGTGTDADCGRFICNTVSGIAYIASLENDGSNVSLYAQVLGISGTLNIDASTAITDVLVLSDTITISAESGIEDVKNSNSTDIIVNAGTVTWSSGFGNLSMNGGTFYWGAEGMTPAGGLDCDLVTLYRDSASFIWQTADTSKSILKQFIAYAGKIDASGPENSGYNKEIGTGTEISELWDTSRADLDNRNHNVTISSGSKIEAFGGTLVPPQGSQVSW